MSNKTHTLSRSEFNGIQISSEWLQPSDTHGEEGVMIKIWDGRGGDDKNIVLTRSQAAELTHIIRGLLG